MWRARHERWRKTVSSATEEYDTWHHRLAALEHEQEIHSRASSVWHRLATAWLGDVACLEVAEIGCGRGDFAIYMASCGAKVTALDMSRTAIEIAQERARELGVCVRWIVGDAEQVGLRTNAFDLVVSCECLEHVSRPERMASELFRILRPGGRCIVTTPSYLNGTLLAWAHSWVTGRPYDSGAGTQPRENFFLYFSVMRMLRRAGFRVIAFDSRLFQFLLLPRVDPARLRVERFGSRVLSRWLRPFGLHFVYVLDRPSRPSGGIVGG